MKKCLIACFVLLIALSAFAQDKIYPVDQLKSDLRFLQVQLDSIHPKEFENLNALLDSLDNSIAKPMNEQQFLSLIMLLNEKIADGHTMFLPSESSMAFNGTQGRFFPFTVAFIGEKLFVIENCSINNDIQPGAEITAINGKAASNILKEMMRRQIRDGQNRTYPLWIINRYFAAYYSYAFGQPASYELIVNGKIHREIQALTRDSIRQVKQRRYGSPKPQKGISLEEKKETAILTIKSFDADWLQSVHDQNFSLVIDSIFKQLRQNHIKNLILDLRDNQGGDFETGRHLLSYLITSPSAYLTGSKESRTLQPKENNFTGKLYVLINGGSFSNTAIVSACLERDGRAVFIGEESGGNKSIVYGDATQVILPNTSIQAYISTTAFPISNERSDHGIIPRHVVKPSLNDLLSGKDAAKMLALKISLRRNTHRKQ